MPMIINKFKYYFLILIDLALNGTPFGKDLKNLNQNDSKKSNNDTVFDRDRLFTFESQI